MPPLLTDAQVSDKWHEIAPLIDRLIERVGTQGEFAVAPRSSIFGDDKASKPWDTSFVLRTSLASGIDHLHAIKVLAYDQRVVHVSAPFSLARAAIENFSVAFWVLHPAERDERVRRTLQWFVQDILDGDNATARLNLAVRSKKDRLEDVYAVARARGISIGSIRDGYKSYTAVKYTDDQLLNQSLHVLFPWQLCSGFAHGRRWAAHAVLNMTTTPSSEPGKIDAKMTSDLGRVLYVTLAALQLLQEFLRLYGLRSN